MKVFHPVFRSSNTLATWCKKLTYWKRPWCWERLRAGGDGGDRDEGSSWTASPTRWTGVWASPGRQWWTGKPGVLQSMGLQRVRHDWGTELNWMTERNGVFWNCRQILSSLQPCPQTDRSANKALCLAYWVVHILPFFIYSEKIFITPNWINRLFRIMMYFIWCRCFVHAES